MSRSVRLTAQANSIALQLTAAEEDLKKAEKLLLEAQQSSPHGTTWLQIGRAYMELENYDSSRRAFEQARLQLHNNPALELFSAILCLDENRWEEAQKHLNELRSICPDNQALPTAQALCYLLQNRAAEALDILRPNKNDSEKYDITVSPLLISRLAAVVENILLPRELPAPDLLNQLAAEDKESTTGDSQSENKTEQTKDGGKREEEQKDQPKDGGEQDEIPKEQQSSNSQKEAGITDPQAFARELQPYLPELPDDMKVGGFHLRGTGTERLQNSWNMPEQERLKQFKLAIHELFQAYCASPKAYQSAFSLAEGLLAWAEYGRERSLPYDEKSLRLVRFAERLLREALIRDKDTAFASHYLARTSLLQHRYEEAIESWKVALDHFAKLPEAYYGIGQALLMLGSRRLGRLYIAHAVNSDMHLLRERLADLHHLTQQQTEKEP